MNGTEFTESTGVEIAFTDLADGIYYDGYTERLATEFPNRYHFELQQFCSDYGYRVEWNEERFVSQN